MRIFRSELKKLLNWRLLLILCLFTGLFYFMFLEFYLYSYPDGHPRTESVELGKELVEKYGPSLDVAEQKEFKTVDYPAIKRAADRRLAGIEEFREAKITTIEALDALSDKTDDASRDLYDKLWDAFDKTIPRYPEKADDYYMYQEARDVVIPSIDTTQENVRAQIASAPAGEARERVGELEKREASMGIPILSWVTADTWRDMVNYFFILLLFTVAILISPYLVRERRSGVRGIAYACRKGRSLFAVQFGASLVAAALAETVQAAVFFALFFTSPHRVDRAFFGADISSANWYWWDMTFGQYIAWSCAVLFMVAFGFAMVSFAVSKFCKNYITVLAVQIPLIFLAKKLAVWVRNNMFSIYRPRCFESLICGLCILAPLALCLFLLHREKASDIR